MSQSDMSASPATIVRWAEDHHYECARCGWPVSHIGGGRFKHVANGHTGPSPCGMWARSVIPRGDHARAIREAVRR